MQKNQDLFSRFRGTIGSGWEMSWGSVAAIYDAVLIPRLAYGAIFWLGGLNRKSNVRSLLSVQRSAFISIIIAYRTASSDSFQVISGKLPLDLEVRWQASRQGA